jgi:hypothetical protein
VSRIMIHNSLNIKRACLVIVIFDISRIRIQTITIGSVADPDPGFGAFLTPGSGIRDERKSTSGSGMNNPDHIF